MSITAPGIYEIDEGAYHADPVHVPSLSRGIAHLLVTRSPMHARYYHPRIGAGGNVEANKAMDAGSAVHSMVLGKGASVVTLKGTYGSKHDLAGMPFEDFKTKAAQEERDALREAGHIPVLQHEHPALIRAASAITKTLRYHQDGADFFAPSKSEVMVVGEVNGVWCRILVDRLPDDSNAPAYDLKLTKLAATPNAWEREMIRKYAFQDAFYRRVLRSVEGKWRPPMRFVVGELEEPHGVSVMCAAPSLASIADAEVDRAFLIWAQCLQDDLWPSYPRYTNHIEAKPWQMQEAENRALSDETIKEMEQ